MITITATLEEINAVHAQYRATFVLDDGSSFRTFYTVEGTLERCKVHGKGFYANYGETFPGFESDADEVDQTEQLPVVEAVEFKLAELLAAEGGTVEEYADHAGRSKSWASAWLRKAEALGLAEILEPAGRDSEGRMTPATWYTTGEGLEVVDRVDTYNAMKEEMGL